ncbi:MAG: mannose-1-phosphate guanylyltransferase/phosphomannomutase [Bacteriovoracaceae bacterium]|jgi:mannose-1-phosphate guanylyltransferase/phosphomannomutase
MKDLTSNCPKPMLLVRSKPILEHTINNLKQAGVTEIGINLHYLGDKIKNYFGNGEKFGVSIKYIYEKAPTGTAGGVKIFEDFLRGSGNFFVIYGDILTNQSFKDFADYHSEKKATASIVVHKRKKSNSIVIVNQDNLVLEFIERPSEEELLKHSEILVNSAIYCFNEEILKEIPKLVTTDFPKDIFPSLVRKQQLFSFPLNGYRCAIDTPERLEMANNEFVP